MSFTTQGHLTDHKRRHSGERPYNCDMCGDKFMRSSTLKIHMRRHTGEKPYKCDKCERGFSESGNLKTHLKVHEEEMQLLGQRPRKEDSLHSSPLIKHHHHQQPEKKRATKGTRKGVYEEEVHPMNELKIDFKSSASTNSKRKPA